MLFRNVGIEHSISRLTCTGAAMGWKVLSRCM